MRKALFIVILLIPAIWCNAQTTSQRLAALEKQQTVFKVQIKWLMDEKKKDSLKFISLEKRVKILEDTAYKYRLVLTFDTTSDFKAIPNATGYLLKIKK